MQGGLSLGRPRKTNVHRDANGISREHERLQKLDYEGRLARRALDLENDGVNPENAPDRLAGVTLGRLLLRWRADKSDPGGISQKQYNTGQRLASVIHRHASINGYSLNIKSPGFIMIGGQDCNEPPSDSEIAENREYFKAGYDAIMKICREYGLHARNLVYGVCIENWPLENIHGKFGLLRITLNEVGRAYATIDKRRQISNWINPT